MKRWTSTWAAMLVAGLVSLPVSSYAQAPAEASTSAAPQTKADGNKAEAGMPQEHLQKADTAVKSISSSAVSGKAASRIAELKQHLSALQTMAATPAGSAAAASTNAPGQEGKSGQAAPQWATHTAAADRIIGELLADSPAGATAPSTATEPAPAGAQAASATAPPLDEETRAKLTTARTSLTAFAASMAGAASPQAATASAAPNAASSASSGTMASAAAPAAQSQSSAPAAQSQPSAPAAQSQPSAPAAQPAPSASADQTAQAEAPQGAPTAQPPAAAAPAAPATASASVEAAKQALTAARDSLSQLTKLPAAQQLTGEARTQMSQLISDFNALITTTTDWKSAYAKVDADVTAILGPTTDQPAPPAPSATPGAVGTSGTETGGLDPGLKAKLAEFRAHLKTFEKAAGAEK